MKPVIIIATHKRGELPKDPPFLPVHAGRALMPADHPDAAWLNENFVGDDTGENISAENGTYNELTALYWAWKNLKDYEVIGFTHYRRHFVYDMKSRKNYRSVRKIKKNFVEKKLKYRDGVIDEILRDNKTFICVVQERGKTVREHYKDAHGAHGLEVTERVIREKFPEYYRAAEEYFNGKIEFFYNMFIMRREDMERYCEFLFGVLAEIKDELGGERLYPSERITGVFMMQLLCEDYRAVRLPVMYVRGRQSFRAAWRESKKNLRANKARKGGMKGRIYAVKPLLKKIIPDFVFAWFYNRRK